MRHTFYTPKQTMLCTHDSAYIDTCQVSQGQIEKTDGIALGTKQKLIQHTTFRYNNRLPAESNPATPFFKQPYPPGCGEEIMLCYEDVMQTLPVLLPVLLSPGTDTQTNRR